ncbi:MAG: transposase, partial [Burkholderiaceae bacterium]
DQRAAKLDGFVSQLAAIDGWVDFGTIAAKIETVCPAPDRSRGGRPPYATEVMVRLLFLQALYGLSDEACEYQMLDRRSFQCFCGLEDELHLPNARALALQAAPGYRRFGWDRDLRSGQSAVAAPRLYPARRPDHRGKYRAGPHHTDSAA